MWMRDVWSDLGVGLRAWRRRPGVAAMAVVVLALGIGATTTVLSLIDRIFLEVPAEVEEPHRLVRIFRAWDGGGGGWWGYPDYLHFRDNARTVSGLGATAGAELAASYSIDGVNSDQLLLEQVSDNFFDVLGVTPVLGREFLPEENATPGTHPVVLLGHDFWTRAFGADRDVLGATITLNGTPFTVIGVMPEAYQGLFPDSPTADAWVPIAMTGALQRLEGTAWWERLPDESSRYLTLIGRLGPGVSFAQAEADFRAATDALQYEGRDEDLSVWVRSDVLYSPRVRDQLTTLTRTLLAVVGIVLLIAAANAAVLLLTHAMSRTREIAVRTAMGAGRGRIVRQLVTESAVLGVAAGVLGIGFAFLAVDVAAALMPVSFNASFRPDGAVLGVGFALAVLTAVVVGLVPAVRAARVDLRSAIRNGDATASGRSPLRAALVVGQLALSVVLLAGALLFGRSFWAASTEEIGFEPENRLVVQVRLRSLGYSEEQGRVFLAEALDRIGRLPGVADVTTTRMIPFDGGQWTSNVDPPPDATPNDGDNVFFAMNLVSPGYFETMEMDILRGRAIDDGDVDGAPLAAVVNEAFADGVWPGLDPLGRTLPYRGGRDFEVVGVVRNANYWVLGEEPVPHVWAAQQQIGDPTMSFLVATTSPAHTLAEPVSDVLRTLEPALAISDVTSLEALVDGQTQPYEVTAVLVGLFGALALLLAAVGLYGVVSFLVSQRTREIGIRMALGADKGRVAGSVLRSGGRLVAIGMVLGLTGSIALRRFTEGMLYGVEPGDPLPLVGATVVLIAVAGLASLVPARRATRVDPLVAMRAD